jgi:exosortase O
MLSEKSFATPFEKSIAQPWFPTLNRYLLLGAWLYAHLATLTWLWRSLKSTSPSTLWLLAIGCVGVLILAVRNRHAFAPNPVLRFWPLVMMGSAGIGAIGSRWIWDLPQVSVFLFAIGSYGLCGLFLAPIVWRRSVWLTLLIACILPFSSQAGSGLGLPLRLLTAQTVEQLLNAWQITAVSSHDVILLENGIAQVDLPCSGVKSLWTGTLLLLAATGLEQRRLGIRWLLTCALNAGLLIAANLLRVLVLVLVADVMGLPAYAQMLHLPLGVVGFIVAAGITWAVLQTVPRMTEPSPNLEVREDLRSVGSSMRGQSLLLSAIVALGVLAPLHLPVPSPLKTFQPPAAIAAQSVALTPVEQEFFNQTENTIAQKWRFASGNLTGSLLVVTSQNWAAFHAPELCLVAAGIPVDRMESRQLTPAIPARWLTVQRGSQSATYWLQSSRQTTDNFLSRFWDYLVHRDRTWTLVSILFDQAQAAESPQMQAFVTTLHRTIAPTIE